MKDRTSKISGLLFFLFLCSGIGYLLLTAQGKNEGNRYEIIELQGNSLLSRDEYLSYAGLKDPGIYNSISMAEVKSNLEKHPYIVKVDVSFDGINKIIAGLIEKEPMAFVLNKNKFNLITVNGELLPLLNDNLVAVLPIISNVKKLKEGQLCENDLEAAFKIIDAVRIADENMYKNLAEINLRSGGDILIMFTGTRFPVVFGRNQEARKILALEKIWETLLKKENVKLEIEYLDLRYKNKIFIGKRKPVQIKG